MRGWLLAFGLRINRFLAVSIDYSIGIPQRYDDEFSGVRTTMLYGIIRDRPRLIMLG